MLSIIRPLIGIIFCLLSINIHSEENKIPEIVQSQISEMNQTCEDVGGRVRGPTNLLIVTDITGDGISDYIINEKSFSCEGAASLYSSSSGSQVKIYIGLSNNSAVLTFEQAVFDIEVLTKVKPAIIELVVRGALCGQNVTQEMSNADLKPCWRPLLWNPSTKNLDFVPLSQIKPFKLL